MKHTKEHDITLPFLIVLLVIVVVVFGNILSGYKLSTHSRADTPPVCDGKPPVGTYKQNCGACKTDGTCKSPLLPYTEPSNGLCYCMESPPNAISISPTPTTFPTTALAPSTSGIPLGLGEENQPCNINKNKIPFCQSGLLLQGDSADQCKCIKPSLNIRKYLYSITSDCDKGLSDKTCKLEVDTDVNACLFSDPATPQNLCTEGVGLEPYAFNDRGEDVDSRKEYIGYFTHMLYVYNHLGKKIINPIIRTDMQTLFTDNFTSMIYFQPYVNINELLCGGKEKGEQECADSIVANSVEFLYSSVNFGKFGWKENEDYYLIPIKSSFGKTPYKSLGEKCNLLFEPCKPGLMCGFSPYLPVCVDKETYKKEGYQTIISAMQYKPEEKDTKNQFSPITAPIKGNGDVFIDEPYTITTEFAKDTFFKFSYLIADSRTFSISAPTVFTETHYWPWGQLDFNGLYLKFYSCDGKQFKRQSVDLSVKTFICDWSQLGPKTIKLLGFDFSVIPDKYDQALRSFNTTTSYSEASITKGLGDIKYPHKNELATPDIQNSVTLNQVNFVGINPAPTPTAYFQQTH